MITKLILMLMMQWPKPSLPATRPLWKKAMRYLLPQKNIKKIKFK